MMAYGDLITIEMTHSDRIILNGTHGDQRITLGAWQDHNFNLLSWSSLVWRASPSCHTQRKPSRWVSGQLQIRPDHDTSTILIFVTQLIHCFILVWRDKLRGYHDAMGVSGQQWRSIPKQDLVHITLRPCRYYLLDIFILTHWCYE